MGETLPVNHQRLPSPGAAWQAQFRRQACRLRRIVGLCLIASFGCSADIREPTHDASDAWSIHREWSIGGVVGTEDALVDVAGAVLRLDGHLFLAQPLDHLVREYDNNGALVRVIGRHGDGPGEFQSLGALSIRSADTLAVVDVGHVSYFDSNGRFLDRAFLPSHLIREGSFSFFASAPTDYVPSDVGGAFLLPGVAGHSQGGDRSRMPVIEVDSDNQVAPLIWVDVMASMAIVRHGSVDVTIVSPFSGGDFVELLRDGSGVVVARVSESRRNHAAFEITKYGHGGEEVWRSSYDYDAIPVSDAHIARAVASARIIPREYSDSIGNEDAIRAMRNVGLVPRYLPPVTGMRSGLDGTLWVRREAQADLVTWDAIDDRGVMIGRIRLPERQDIIAANGPRIAAIEHNEWDVPLITVYSLVRE